MESIEVWHYLVAFAFLAFIVEIFTIGFIAGSVGIGLLFASVGSYLGLSTEIQFLLFSGGLGVSFFTIKPIMEKLIYNKDAEKTNKDAMIGKQGQVVENIDSQKGTGRVKIDGDNWKAKAKNGVSIEEGKMVEIVEIDSIVLIVKEI